MITTFIFDLGGVLFTNGTKKFVQDISKKYNIDQIKVLEVIEGDLGTQYRESKITRDAFWQKVVEELQLKESIDSLEQEWINGYELIEGTRDIIQELRNRYKVFYLSDNVKKRAEEINTKYHYMDWFDGGIFSYEVGVRKPNPKVYEFALEKAQAKPEEVVFIDDKPSALIPAKDMGIITIHFTSPEELTAKLQVLNFL